MMPRKGRSFIIGGTVGPQDDALCEGIDWLLAAAKNGNAKQALVVVATLGILDNIGWSSHKSLFAMLKSNRQVTKEGVTIFLAGKKKDIPITWNDPILVIYGGQKLLDDVDAIEGTAHVLYVPWSEGDADDWVKTWSAHDLRGIEKPASESLALPKVALKALARLTNSVNFNNGLASSFERERTIETLETLHHKNVRASPAMMRQEIVRLGWDPKVADDFRDLAKKIEEGRRPKGSTGRADEHLWSMINS